MAWAIAKGCYFDFTSTLFNTSFSPASHCPHHLPVSARPSSGPACFCRDAGYRDRSPVARDYSLTIVLSLRLEGVYLQCGKSTQRTDAYMNARFTSDFVSHPVLSSVSFQSPGARSQMSHLACVSETKAQNAWEVFSAMLLSALLWLFTEQRHKLSLPTKWLFLFFQQKHQQRCSCWHLVASQTFPRPYHRQLIFPLQSPWV